MRSFVAGVTFKGGSAACFAFNSSPCFFRAPMNSSVIMASDFLDSECFLSFRPSSSQKLGKESQAPTIRIALTIKAGLIIE